ncbi:hypothetical protein PF006_g24312 [Phytophthora fragariae]|uniref:Nuclear speckle splicing regulatory protein 1 N-terminal domain-containing protein n=1 Tax=Phytophthora fragariae TaxID=53985 RepID=A0A6A3RCJ5_9STRA|nr:hypothetical protein PF006_g24312 [Phytophthora fragariae]
MAFSMKLPAGKGKKKPLAAPLSSGGKQYGLIIPKKDAKKKELATGFNVFASAAAASSSKPSAAEREKDARRRVGAEAARSLQQSQVDKMRAQALADDPSVFDYDAVYDDMKSARESAASQRAAKREAEKKKPKYIATLLQQAKIRDVENERIREQRLLNERKADDALYGDKDKLVSASYKRKLQEMQRWDAEDARLATLEEHEDVTKQGEHAMAGFYANLNQNIAMGGSTDNARSAYTAKKASADEGPARPDREREHEREAVKTLDEPAIKKTKSSEQPREGQSPPLTARDEPESDKTDASSTQKEEKREEAKPSKEDAIAAARARFLARKAQRQAPSSTT